MVRRCVVPECTQTDVSTLAHRFPRRHENAINWQVALELNHIPLHELVSRHVVCTQHFKTSDYRNAMSNSLNFTACPSLSNQTDRFEIVVEPKAVGFVELPEPSPPPPLPPTPSPPTPPKVSQLPNGVVLRKINIPKKEEIVIDDQEISTSIEIIEIAEEMDDFCEMENDGEVILVGPSKTKAGHSHEKAGLPKKVLNLYPSTSESATKRKRSSSPIDEELQLYITTGVQTEGDPDDAEIEKEYPQYKDTTKIDLVKLLSERDDKIRELEAKCDKLKQIIQNW